MSSPRKPRSMRSLLFGQFGAVVATATVVAALFLVAWRLPVAREQMQREQARLAELVQLQLEHALDNAEALVKALAAAAAEPEAGRGPAAPMGALFARVARGGPLFDAVYRVDADSRVVAIGTSTGEPGSDREWLAFDLSGVQVIQDARASGQLRWSEQFVSPVQGHPVVAVAAPTTAGAVVAEVSVERLARIALQATRIDGLLVVVVDAKGEVVAAPDMALARQRVNIGNLPLIRDALQGRASFAQFEFGGRHYNGTTARSARLAWAVLVAYPASVADASRHAALFITAATMALSLGVGLYTLHRLSRSVERRLDESVGYAQAVADGRYGQDLARSDVRELDELNASLRRMAGQIRQREGQLRAIIDQTPNLAVQLYSADGRIVDWNPASSTILGWSRSEVLGLRLVDVNYTPEQQQAFDRILQEMMATGRPVGPFEGTVKRRDGSPCVLLSTTFAIHAPGDEPLFACMDIDITAKKRQEDQLRANEEKFSTFFDANPVALAVLRRHGPDEFEYLDINAAWVELLGAPREDLQGLVVGPRRGFSVFADADERRAFLGRLERGEPILAFEFQLQRRDGGARRAEINLAHVHLHGEHLLVYSMHDVTDKRALEDELRELNAQLEQRVAQRTTKLAEANRDLQRTLEELQLAQERLVESEKLASLGALVAGVAHELNTPIGNGLMAVSTIEGEYRVLRGRLDGGVRRRDFDAFLRTLEEGCAIALRNLERASSLVQGFKQVSVDQTSEQRRSFDLKTTLGEILLTLRPTFRHSAVEIAASVPEGLELDSYPGALGQVLTNLLHNAVQHGLEGRADGVVLIRAAPCEDDQVRIEVVDNGRGIDAQVHKHVFDPFFTTRLGHGGSGLGLSIVRSIVTGRLGGRIGFDSTPGVGTVFFVILPRSAPDPGSRSA